MTNTLTNTKSGLQLDKNTLATQKERNKAVIQMLDEWLKDETGYQEENWPKIKQTLEENRSSYRRLFND